MEQLPASPPTHLSREEILRVTAECLLNYGYDKTTIRQIASMLRCAVGSIYRYFPDKRSLLYAVAQEVLSPVAEAVNPGEGHAPAPDALHQSVRLYHQRAAAAPEVYRLMFWLACVGHDDSAAADPRQLPEVVTRIIDGWTKLLGSVERARWQWAMLHSGLMLGQDEPRFAAAGGDRATAPTDGQVEHAPTSGQTFSGVAAGAAREQALDAQADAVSDAAQESLA